MTGRSSKKVKQLWNALNYLIRWVDYMKYLRGAAQQSFPSQCVACLVCPLWILTIRSR